VAPKPGGALWSDAEEMCRVNSLLLGNFLAALVQAEIRPQRFMLQTGAKNYGVHLGPTKVPQEETDPRVELEPNFYYPQEDSLFAYGKQEGVGWNICMPGPILGAVPDAAMNAAFPLAVYAAVSKHLGVPLQFTADVASWQMYQSMSSSKMNAYVSRVSQIALVCWLPLLCAGACADSGADAGQSVRVGPSTISTLLTQLYRAC
jgi:hypothetical protein